MNIVIINDNEFVVDIATIILRRRHLVIDVATRSVMGVALWVLGTKSYHWLTKRETDIRTGSWHSHSVNILAGHLASNSTTIITTYYIICYSITPESLFDPYTGREAYCEVQNHPEILGAKGWEFPPITPDFVL